MKATKSKIYAAALALMLPLACGAGQEAVALMSTYSARVVHIETIGVLHDESLKDDVGSGSGFLIGSRHVLSVGHNIPRESAYRTLKVNIRLGSPQADPLAVDSYERDPERDLVLITLRDPAPFDTRSCPMPVIKDATLAPLGTDLLAMGFPLDLGIFRITPGMLNGYAQEDNYWLTNALITYGDSGGPVFAHNGALLGLAAAGATSWDLGGEKRAVAGVNFLVPAIHLRTSPLMATIERIPQPERCWRTVPDGEPIELSNERRVESLPALVQRSLTIAVTKSDRIMPWSTNRPYEHRITADPGYRITQCTWQASSANYVAKERCVIDEKGESAVFSFELTSGPFWNRYRGWWGGLMLVDQRRL